VADVLGQYPEAPLTVYLKGLGREDLREVIIRQPEFFKALYDLARERPIEDLKTYLRWHVLAARAPYLNAAVEDESFAFFGKVLRGQPAQEPVGSGPRESLTRRSGRPSGSCSWRGISRRPRGRG
jgi:predicted metalloendopeptidase